MASYHSVILREKTMIRKLLTAMFFVLLTFSITRPVMDEYRALVEREYPHLVL